MSERGVGRLVARAARPAISARSTSWCPWPRGRCGAGRAACPESESGTGAGPSSPRPGAPGAVCARDARPPEHTGRRPATWTPRYGRSCSPRHLSQPAPTTGCAARRPRCCGARPPSSDPLSPLRRAATLRERSSRCAPVPAAPLRTLPASDADSGRPDAGDRRSRLHLPSSSAGSRCTWMRLQRQRIRSPAARAMPRRAPLSEAVAGDPLHPRSAGHRRRRRGAARADDRGAQGPGHPSGRHGGAAGPAGVRAAAQLVSLPDRAVHGIREHGVRRRAAGAPAAVSRRSPSPCTICSPPTPASSPDRNGGRHRPRGLSAVMSALHDNGIFGIDYPRRDRAGPDRRAMSPTRSSG